MIRCLLTSLAIAASNSVFAQDEGDPLEIAFELGAISTTGNTETLSIQSKADIRQDLERWQNEYLVSVLFKEDQVTQQDGSQTTEKTAEKYFGSAKSAYKLDREHSTLFIFGSHTDDEFGAFEKYTTASVGYGTRLLDKPTMYLDVEIGPGYFRGERVTEDNTVEIENGVMVRGATEYRWQFTDNARFAQTISVESGSDNTRTISDTSLTTKISDTLQMKVGFSMFHDSNVAADKESLDTTTFINVVYSL